MGNIKKPKDRPEYNLVQLPLVKLLTARDWYCEETHGNAFQTGFPDVYTMHRKWGRRWIDCKVEGKYNFTKAQRIKWPIWEKFSTPIWIITGAGEEDYAKLFQPANWREYWKKTWGELPDIDKLLDELIREQAADGTGYFDC